MKYVKQTKRSERFTYGMYFVGQLFIYALISGFLQLFFTDIGIPAMTVGVIFMVAKVWDAINDPFFGVIIDRTRTKRGKFTPWIKLSSFLIPVATVALFAIPTDASVQIKTIWAVAAYLIWDTAYTLSDVPIYALSTAMTSEISERNKLLYTAKLLGFIGAVPASIAIPLLYPNIGWFGTALALAAIALPTMVPIGFIAKERARVASDEKVSVKRLVAYLFKNKYLITYVVVILVMSLTGFSATVRNYVALYCLGGSEWMAVMNLTYLLPILLGPFLYPLLNKFMSRGRLFGVSGLAVYILGIMQFLCGYGNVTLFLALDVAKSIFTGIIAVGLTMSIADCVVYGTYKTGERAEAVTFSVQTFCSKITSAVSGAIGMFVLGAVGFVEGAGAVQTQHVVDSTFFMYCGAPCISGTIAMIIWLLMFRLKDDDIVVMSKCNSGEITRSEAEDQLSRKY
jgi:sugar (glycoside-pentoside-hexuronide) transporter